MALYLRRKTFCLRVLLLVIGFSSNTILLISANIVFKVHKTSITTSLTALKTHNNHRHGRLLSSSSDILDLPLDGNGSPTGAALYYTKIGIGTPPVDYHVQVDTGSNILWVNCANCDTWSTESGLGINLKLYDKRDSTTASVVTCDEESCAKTVKNLASCSKTGSKCTYGVSYGDGSSGRGYFVKDNLQLNCLNSTIAFGCGNNQSEQLSQPDRALDGILGLAGDSSMISQLARDGEVRKKFFHCLNGNNGGGLFSIWQVAHPEMNSTRIIPNQTHYNINLEGFEVGRVTLPFSTSKKVIVDSGTTLAYLENDLYELIIEEIMAAQPSLRLLPKQQFTCFQFRGNVDDGFPTVTFHFENSLSFYPHDYLFPLNKDILQKNNWCIGWQRGIITNNGGELYLLGDMVLSNKMVVYDLENMTIGWTEHDCSSSNEMFNENTGEESPVVYNDLSSSFATDLQNIWWFN